MTCASVAELWVAGMRVFLEVARHEYREKYASSSPILYSAQGRNELRARAKGQTAKTLVVVLLPHGRKAQCRVDCMMTAIQSGCQARESRRAMPFNVLGPALGVTVGRMVSSRPSNV